MYKIISALGVAFFAFIIWIIYLANTGGDSIFFDFVRKIPYGDKIGHVGIFGVLTFMAIAGSKFKTFYLGGWNVYYGAILVILFVVCEELSQFFIPSRNFDLLDLTANFIGITGAMFLAYILHRYVKNNGSSD